MVDASVSGSWSPYTKLVSIALIAASALACGAEQVSDATTSVPAAQEANAPAALLAPEKCGATSGITASTIHHVSPRGSASAGGTTFVDALDIKTALARVQPGELILLEPGLYTVPYVPNAKNTIQLTKSGTKERPIHLAAARCGRARFDFSFPEQAWVQDSFGFLLKGDYWVFKGIDVTRAGYQGVYVTGKYNTFDSCGFYDNRNSGLEINKGGAYTTVINCDAYRNYDPKKLGGMADGFASKQTQGPGNRFIGCRAWENSDDGYDTFDSAEVVTIEDSWAFDNGMDVWKYPGFAGNGNGFKIGGNYKLANNSLVRSVAFGNRVKGFDQNHNTGGLTLHHCIGYANGINYGIGGEIEPGQKHDLRNNVSFGARDTIENAAPGNNSWDLGLTVGAADFVSLDLTQARLPRLPDGSLPAMTLFRLAAGSRLIDKGVAVGGAFAGAAPDLGPFEHLPAP